MSIVTKLSHVDARKYFLETENYVNFDLPPYFNFTDILNNTSVLIGSKGLHDFFSIDPTTNKRRNPADYESVNHRLISNKDGEFSWRPMEIIHPALYVALVNEITSEKSWEELVKLFEKFEQNTAVSCESIPVVSKTSEKHKAKQIMKWWTNVEQASIKMGLKYKYVFDADISDCYGSIYTHSISWALHGKKLMKEKRGNMTYLGNRIDVMIEKMRHRQTNGIPQGSTLMDFIAEIVLGYIDIELVQRLDSLDIEQSQYDIIRYRDDYKIFTNNPEIGHRIVKELSSTLSSLGMKLNTEKTYSQNDIISASVKNDKLFELSTGVNDSLSLSKQLLQIYENAKKYRNSGMVVRQASSFFTNLEKKDKLSAHNDPIVMISIATNLAIKNPKAYQWYMAIVSQLLFHCNEKQRAEIIADIQSKLSLVPNTGMLDIWLQRATYKINPSLEFDEPLTRIVAGILKENTIWESGWAVDDLKEIILKTPIIDMESLEQMPKAIPKKEVELFRSPVFS